MDHQDLLNHYPGGYSASNDSKVPDRARNYEYMDRMNDLGSSVLEQSMGMGTSSNTEYRYSGGPVQSNQLCPTANPQALLTPPQATEDATDSITNASPTVFAYSTLPRIPTSAPHSLDYYTATNSSYLPSFSGSSQPQTERRPGTLHMPPVSPPYGVSPSFTYSVHRPNMSTYAPLPPQRSATYNEPFRIPPASSLMSYSSGHQSWPPSMTQQPLLPPPRPEGPPFEVTTKTCVSLYSSHQQPVEFDILASIPKGFFFVANNWTCYRRNYFSVACGFTLKSHHVDGQVYLSRYPGASHIEPVTEFAMSISAKTAAANSTESESRGLTQHTPKRDKATEKPPSRQIVAPAPATNLSTGHGIVHSGLYPTSHMGPFSSAGLDNYGTTAAQSPQTQVTFERIQFVKATANNGKRRAQQQYFHVVVSLEAKVGRPGQSEEWITVASRSSSPMVVRGRSPGHYKDARQNGRSSMDPDNTSGHHNEMSSSSGYSLNPAGSSNAAGYGTHLNSYRLSHSYGNSYNHSTQAMDDSGSSTSTSSTGSPSMPGSPLKDELRRSAQRQSLDHRIPTSLDRMGLSSSMNRPDLNSIDYRSVKKRTFEEAGVSGYYSASASQNGWKANPTFDFSATSTQTFGTSA